MIDYSYVLPESSVLAEIEQLYIESFPAQERRNFASVRRLLEMKHVPFKIIAATENGNLVGFLSYWDFVEFRYVEHFAVDAKLRGRGCGSELLSHFIDAGGKIPIILEVESPDNDMARRRVDFYMRHCFIIWKRVCYMQPPYEVGYEPLELKLMTLHVNDQSKVEEMGRIVQHEVYKSIDNF